MRELTICEIEMISGGDIDASEVVEIVVEGAAIVAGAALLATVGGVLIGTVGTAVGAAEIFGISGAALRTLASYAIKQGLTVAAASAGAAYTLSKADANLRDGSGHMAIP